MPKDWLGGRTQESMIAPSYANIGNTVYTNNQEKHEIYRVDAGRPANTPISAP